MSTYILENSPETVKWLLGRKHSMGNSRGGDSIILWENIHHFIVVDSSSFTVTGIRTTLKEYQELEVLKALGITCV